jgi:hypothetical protein
MSTLEEDLAHLNFEYLMLARECAKSNPMEASWRFRIDLKEIETFANLSLEQIKEISAINRAVITLLPMKASQVSTASYSALLVSADVVKGSNNE